MSEKYFVLSKFYDNGKTEAEILNSREAKINGFYNGYKKETSTCDIYVEGFTEKSEAKAWVREILAA